MLRPIMIRVKSAQKRLGDGVLLMQKSVVDGMSVAAAARRLGVGLDFVYLLLRSGKLAGRKVGRQWLVSAEAVEERRKRIEEQRGLGQ